MAQLEQAFSGLIMLLGTMVMGYVTASVTGALANADFKRTRFQEKVAGTVYQRQVPFICFNSCPAWCLATSSHIGVGSWQTARSLAPA